MNVVRKLICRDQRGHQASFGPIDDKFTEEQARARAAEVAAESGFTWRSMRVADCISCAASDAWAFSESQRQAIVEGTPK